MLGCALKRFADNPILTRQDLSSSNPSLHDPSSIFNPGAVIFQEQHLLLLRVQNRGRETFIVKAVSDDGYSFKLDSEPVLLAGLEDFGERIYHLYDPRVTRVGEDYFVTLAIDCESGCRSALFSTTDFNRLQFVSLLAEVDARNGVLFPEKIKGKYNLLLRPNRTTLENGITTGSSIMLFESDDLIDWTEAGELISGRPHYWDELIGSGPPPVKTRAGWLHIYHGLATHFQSANIYQAGVVLLDLNHPAKVIGRSRQNILEPREPYELMGQVPNVVFPTGMIVEKTDADRCALPDSRVKIYYGAADTVVALAETTIAQLLKACQ